MRSRPAFVIVAACWFLSGACTGGGGVEESGWGGSVVQEDGVTVVRNPSEPAYGEITLDLEEDLVLGDTLSEKAFFSYLISAAVAPSGTLYVWDPFTYEVRVFGADGGFIQGVGREGEGPGEFSDASKMAFHATPSGSLAVLNAARVHLFSPTLEFGGSFPAGPTTSRFALLSGGGILRDQLTFGEEGPTEDVVLTDGEGEEVRRSASFPSEKWRGAMVEGLRFTHLAPELTLVPLGDGGGAFGFPLEYRITVVGVDGSVDRVVAVEEEPLVVGGDLREALMEDAAARTGESVRELEGEVYIPGRWPYFDAIFSDEEGNLYVRRSEPLPDPDSGSVLDLISRRGFFVARMRVPVRDIQAIRNGFLYASRYDGERFLSQLIRYRIRNWSEVESVLDTMGEEDS